MRPQPCTKKYMQLRKAGTVERVFLGESTPIGGPVPNGVGRGLERKENVIIISKRKKEKTIHQQNK